MNLSIRFLKLNSLWLLAAMLLMVACKSAGQNKMPVGCKQSITQGLQGKVIFKSGNLMPGPDRPEDGGRPVEREVHIYELTKTSQVESDENQFITKISTNLIKVVKSDSTGCFQAELAPGRYSVFVMEKGNLYANLFDGEGNIFPVKIDKGEVTKIDFEITYAATF